MNTLLRRTLNLTCSLAAVLFTLYAYAIPAQASANPPLRLGEDTRQASLTDHMDGYVDASNKLGYPEAVHAHYTPLKGNRSAGYSPAAHWYRFTISREADAPRNWVLALGEPFLDHVDVWFRDETGQLRHYQLGDHADYRQRPLQTHQFAIPLKLSDSALTFFVRVESISSINFNATVWQPTAFTAAETDFNFLNGLYFGVLGIIAVFYLIIGSWLRDGGMLAYSGYVITLFLLYLGTNGYVAVLLPTAPPWLSDAAVGTGIGGGLVAATTMWRLLLELRQNFPRINRIYAVISYVFFCSLPFVTTSLYRSIAPLELLSVAFVITSSLILTSLLCWRQRRLEYFLYLLSFTSPMIAALMAIFTILGWLPHHTLSASVYQYTSLVHVLVMSLALAFRLRQIQLGKAQAEQEVAVSAKRADEQRRFIAMLSHEFRNPLAAIERATQMLQFNLPDIKQEEALRLNRIHAGVSTLSRLVDNFLTSEALHYNTLALSPEPCPLRPLLERVVQTLGDDAARRVTISVTPDDACHILDKNMMEMAVGNLVANALRYSPEDTQVTASAAVDSTGLVLEIRDQGPGLDADELNRLGMPYYRASTSQGKKGSGLGYYFTRRVAEAHGGTLQASSGQEQGLSVAIHLPPDEGMGADCHSRP